MKMTRQVMFTGPCAADYVALSADGAEWLVAERPQVRAVGIDYLSIANMADLVEAHVVLLRAGVVPIEGLLLPEPRVAGGGVKAGWWFLHCAPLKLEGSDGAPARAFLTPMH